MARAQKGMAAINTATRHKLIELADPNHNLPDKERGLYPRYEVKRIGGTPGKHNNCKLFVLDLDHDAHAAPGLLAYAMSAKADGFELLANDLLSLIQPYIKQLNEQAQTGEVDVLTDIEQVSDAELHRVANEHYLNMQAGTAESEVWKELLHRFAMTLPVPEPAPKAKRAKKLTEPVVTANLHTTVVDKPKRTRKKKDETATPETEKQAA